MTASDFFKDGLLILTLFGATTSLLKATDKDLYYKLQ